MANGYISENEQDIDMVISAGPIWPIICQYEL